MPHPWDLGIIAAAELRLASGRVQCLPFTTDSGEDPLQSSKVRQQAMLGTYVAVFLKYQQLDSLSNDRSCHHLQNSLFGSTVSGKQ
jgi:hypothetical protein